MTISKVFVPKVRKNKRAIEVGYFKHQDSKVCCKRKRTFVLFFWEFLMCFFFQYLLHCFRNCLSFSTRDFYFYWGDKESCYTSFFKGLKKLHNLLEGWNSCKNKVFISENLFLAIFEHENFDFNLHKTKWETITSKRHLRRSK